MKDNYTLILKELRAKVGITQKELAESIGISKFAYNRKENGHNDFTLSEMKKISKVLKVEPSEIFFG